MAAASKCSNLFLILLVVLSTWRMNDERWGISRSILVQWPLFVQCITNIANCVFRILTEKVPAAILPEPLRKYTDIFPLINRNNLTETLLILRNCPYFDRNVPLNGFRQLTDQLKRPYIYGTGSGKIAAGTFSVNLRISF